MNTVIFIGFCILSLWQGLDWYTLYRARQIRRIQREIFNKLPRNDNYKFMVALHVYIQIRWSRFIYKDFFKKITVTRLFTPHDLSALRGNYTTIPRGQLTNQELNTLVNNLKNTMYEHRFHIPREDEKPADQYEF